METTLRGIGVSPGIAIGPVVVFGDDRVEIPKYTVSDVVHELDRFEKALESTRVYLQDLHAKATEKLGSGHADIFKAHLLLLEDVTLLEQVKRRIEEEELNVEHILDELSQYYANLLGAVEDSHFQARTADLLDVMERLQRNLLNEERPRPRELDAPAILLAHDFSPSDTVMIERKFILGMALDSGSPTSHTSILARALEIPAVMGLRHAAAHVRNETSVIIDGNEGLFIANPSPETLEGYRASFR